MSGAREWVVRTVLGTLNADEDGLAGGGGVCGALACGGMYGGGGCRLSRALAFHRGVRILLSRVSIVSFRSYVSFVSSSPIASIIYSIPIAPFPSYTHHARSVLQRNKHRPSPAHPHPKAHPKLKPKSQTPRHAQRRRRRWRRKRNGLQLWALRRGAFH